jgi:hypothetical protein
MRVTKQRPFLEAQNFHHKLQILLEAISGCKTSSETRRSHDYFQYDQRAYHCIAAFNGVIEPHQNGHLHWHIMLYSSRGCTHKNYSSFEKYVKKVPRGFS